MKKKPNRGESKPIDVKSDHKDERPDNIHQIRKKIEDILIEREQKKQLDW
ncbi:hypothetical protein ACODM8_14790 [Vibrio ostreicida]|uniref:Uncharacterized protein n=1 Tax=Vibrio ostreicida TaxID=526588 RepID=A0ABT8C2B9_9VIBR|nr:hypothetical protein [Vibrio ostreicida]MDN3612505.1 hypothetical protein [Vibrio ostreicida]NPD09132.1 hypothetical protein [Vibrio ostreicida]